MRLDLTRVRQNMKFLLPWILCCSLGTCSAQSGQTAKEIYESTNASVFLIYLNDSSGKPVAFGTGFEVGPNTIATNAHVVQGGSPVLAVGPIRIPATIVKLDKVNDLAILSVAADLTSRPLPLASQRVKQGERIFAIGNPEGLEKTISEGIVSGIRNEGSKSLLQVTSPISHGSSGGPVLDSKGYVVGVAVGMYTEGQNLNFAVPVSYLSELLAMTPSTSSVAVLSKDDLDRSISELNENSYSLQEDSPYQKKLTEIRNTLASLVHSNDPALLMSAICTTYATAPDTLGDTLVDLSRQALRLKGSPAQDLHAVIAYELGVQAALAEDGAERVRLISLSEAEARQASSASQQRNGTADYVLEAMYNLEKRYAESLLLFQKTLQSGTKRYACGWDLGEMTYREAITAASSVGSYSEAERIFRLLVKRGGAADADWDAEGDRRSDHHEYGEAALAYEHSLASFPLNACFASVDRFLAPEDSPDDVLRDGRKCIDTTTKTSASGQKAYEQVLGSVHWAMSLALTGRGVFSEALSHAKDAIAIDPKDGNFYYALATALQNLGRTQECISAAKQAIMLTDGSNPSFHFLLGNCYFEAENWTFAAQSFRLAAEGNRHDAEAAYNLGLSLKRGGFGGDAKQWFEEALRRGPSQELRETIQRTLK